MSSVSQAESRFFRTVLAACYVWQSARGGSGAARCEAGISRNDDFLSWWREGRGPWAEEELVSGRDFVLYRSDSFPQGNQHTLFRGPLFYLFYRTLTLTAGRM